MERFGYITDPFCDREYFYIHNVLYVDIVSCIENVHIRRNTDEHVKIVYFKTLTNSEIVRFLHEKQTEEKRFGFCQLTRYNPTEKFKVYSSLKVLFENILETVQRIEANILELISWQSSDLFKTSFHQCLYPILEGASKKRKIDISEKEKNSVKHKTINKRLTRSESESDVESINDVDERNSLFGKNRKPGALNQHEKYDVVIRRFIYIRLAEEIHLLSE
ncbi:uncharacterized protein TNIN_424391 [Trichonephila inaurata madagascariensis]|uniref:Uncharacterized protein n=1 Tax=Trichonephila inaurata madagascariensis TaxID=2747483 RepID=A0A8X6XM34_9ARAC|nr:uncharacterized protein TNIN_424391 [Trichonephila inaurata madagascariensis]